MHKKVEAQHIEYLFSLNIRLFRKFLAVSDFDIYGKEKCFFIEQSHFYFNIHRIYRTKNELIFIN